MRSLGGVRAELSRKVVAMTTEVLSRYRLIRKLGAGGMGVVYEAEDLRLGRLVALKFLSGELANDPHALERFRREARATSSLNHPHICDIHDIDVDDEGRAFIVMEKLDGATLAEKIASQPLPMEKVVELAIQIVEALTAAHAKGIVHRDLKPGNIFITADGQAKLLDFGLAKIAPQISSDATVSEADSLTAAGALVGTMAYMAPEQALGKPVDARTDLFSFGLVLYEMATGKRPFRGFPIDATLHASAERPSKLNCHVTPPLEAVILKCLETAPDQRFQSAAELLNALRPLAAAFSPVLRRHLLRPIVAGSLLALLLMLVLATAWLWRRNARVNWARAEAIPRIADLMERSHYIEAFQLADEAERYIPGDARLQKLWPEISRVLTIHSQPEGAEVYLREYNSEEGAWQYLGRTPIQQRRVPWAFFRWRIEKPGYVTANLASGGKAGRAMMFPETAGGFSVALQKEGSVPPGMVFVKGGNFRLDIPGLDHLPPVRVGDYFIDRFEVTNAQFKQFVDAGGYSRKEFWKQPFVRDGRVLSWKEAMAQFRDKTGRPGPSAWMLGDYPEGQAEFPVAGVNWYEAAAYAEFAGKQLPTIYHWIHAAGLWGVAYIAPLSNFGGSGPVKTGSTRGMNPFGAYDMAGNVKEWCWNDSKGKRYILGGAWSEPTYMFTDRDAQDPWRRMPAYGFRLAKYPADASAPMLASIAEPFRDYSREKPVSDQVFRIYQSLFAYDKKPLDAVIEAADESSEVYRRERVTFTAGYGRERVTAYVFLPKSGAPPYQTVIYFPGSDAIYQRVDDLQLWRFRYLVKSGRAVVYPIYKGTYSRGDELNSDYQNATAMWRDHVIYWSKDLGRTVDYIQSRNDLDHEKIAYLGFSWGAYIGSVLPAMEPRIKTVLLVGGGFEFQKTLPEVDPINFAPRVKQPALMINGRYDSVFPVEALQEPMFRLLGAPDKDKRHLIFESGHVPPNELLIKETLDWLDHYLGSVK